MANQLDGTVSEINPGAGRPVGSPIPVGIGPSAVAFGFSSVWVANVTSDTLTRINAANLLVHGGRLVMIDMPQIVDVIANPRGAEFLTRDSANVARWFTARGLTGVRPAPADLAALLLAEARLP